MKIRSIILIMAAFAAVACSENAPSTGPRDAMHLDLSVVVPESVPQTQTRSAIGPARPDSPITSFSMCAIPDQASNAAWYNSIGYDNIRGTVSWFNNTYTVNAYSYTPRGTATTNPRLGLFPTKGSVTVYGVYPYMADLHTLAGGIEHVPFTVGTTGATNYDYMYVDPIYVDMTGVKPGDTQSRNVDFKHVMTAVELRLSATHVGTVGVDSITLRAFDGAAPAKIFAMEGTFSAKDGSVAPAPGSYADKLNIVYNNTVNYLYSVNSFDRYTPYTFIFPSVEHKPGRKLVATIYFKYIEDSDLDLVGLGGEMVFEFDNIKNAGLNKGLEPARRYIYTVEIDNFIKYSGYPEIEEWVAPTDDPDDDQVKDIII